MDKEFGNYMNYLISATKLLSKKNSATKSGREKKMRMHARYERLFLRKKHSKTTTMQLLLILYMQQVRTHVPRRSSRGSGGG